MTGERFDSSALRDENSTSHILSGQAFSLGLEDWRGPAIAGGAGFSGGAALTGLGEIGLIKAALPIYKPLLAVGFAMLGGGRAASQILYAPSPTAMECLRAAGPKPLVIGGLVGMTLAVGGYEAYEHWKNKV
jgi:hypothetical protein